MKLGVQQRQLVQCWYRWLLVAGLSAAWERFQSDRSNTVEQVQNLTGTVAYLEEHVEREKVVGNGSIAAIMCMRTTVDAFDSTADIRCDSYRAAYERQRAASA